MRRLQSLSCTTIPFYRLKNRRQGAILAAQRPRIEKLHTEKWLVKGFSCRAPFRRYAARFGCGAAIRLDGCCCRGALCAKSRLALSWAAPQPSQARMGTLHNAEMQAESCVANGTGQHLMLVIRQAMLAQRICTELYHTAGKRIPLAVLCPSQQVARLPLQDAAIQPDQG